MATRSLTEVFILMRNNALQNRHIFSEQVADDRQALVSRDGDVELGITSKSCRLPPDWVDGVEEVQFEVSRIKQKMKELASLHDKHLNRPTLDDNVDEEHAIEIQTAEITKMFSRCQLLVRQICGKSRIGTHQEQKLSTNIVSSLARTLQDISTNFKKSQSHYLKKLKTREERSNQFFGVDLGGSSSLMMEEDENLYDRGFTDVQLQAVDNNSVMVQQRDREISQIVRSINDLNEIFKDLATMIVDQGTLLDRIDYNIEQTSTRVEQGLKQLQKAEKHQKKNRKMLCIVILFGIIVFLIVLLIAKKAIF